MKSACLETRSTGTARSFLRTAARRAADDASLAVRIKQAAFLGTVPHVARKCSKPTGGGMVRGRREDADA
jgi:hypothetical protein